MFKMTVSSSDKTKIDSSFLTRLPDYLAFVFMLFIVVYTAARAYYSSLTHDEAFTFLYHARGSFFDILTYQGGLAPANNHLLNTLLIKMFTSLFGISEFVIRIPALMGLVLYLIGVHKILNLFLKKYSLLLGIGLLTCHPFLLDMFSCARGYSLALGFMMLGLYYFFISISSQTNGAATKYYIMASIMFSLSVLSQFLFINIYVSMIGVYLLFQLTVAFVKKESFPLSSLVLSGRNMLLGIVPTSVFLFIIYYYPVMKMANNAPWGGNNGFWQDTVGSLVKASLSPSVIDARMIGVSKIIIIALLFIALIIILRDMIKSRALIPINQYLLCILSLLFLSSFIVVGQHYFLSIEYPFNRFALYFIPPFLFMVLLSLANIKFIKNRFIRTSLNVAGHLLVVCLLIIFIGQARFTHFISWKYDASTKAMMADIIAMNQNKNLPDNSIRLGIDWNFEPSTNYYILKNNMRWMRKTDRSGPMGTFDYYYVFPHQKKYLDENRIAIIKRYKESGNYLAVCHQCKNE